jgi:hypothetical protein
VGLFVLFCVFSGVVDESFVFVAAQEARSMLQGVRSRFDFHINKTLCDLRCVLHLCKYYVLINIKKDKRDI